MASDFDILFTQFGLCRVGLVEIKTHRPQDGIGLHELDVTIFDDLDPQPGRAAALSISGRHSSSTGRPKIVPNTVSMPSASSRRSSRDPPAEWIVSLSPKSV